MNDQEFDALCNELAQLTRDAGQLPVAENARRILDDVRVNASAQHFQIVLVSPFQGGKSTIFNTLCGGRELSPTGFGLKTSAAVAEARYLEDEREEEHAVLEWRTDAELLESMDLLLPKLPQVDPRRFGSRGAAEEGGVRLDHPRDRYLLQKAVELCHDDPEIARRPEKTDLLDVSWLMLEHYPYAVRELRPASRVPLAQATQWLTFPLDWVHRRPVEFGPEEVVFLYLKRVVFYLREPALRTLRASIIDAPGLQASPWDTSVATESISRAHAVIFLLGTQAKAMTLSDLGEVGRFNEYGLAQNVFYGYNAKGTHRNVARQSLLPADLARLSQAGANIPEDRLSIFNARLAYRARQYELIEQGRLPDETIAVLSQKAQYVYGTDALPDGGRNDRENARYLIENELETSLREFTGRRIQQLGVEVAVDAARESNWEELIQRTSQFVIARKGGAILIDRGSRMIEKVLDWLEGDLTDREKAADRSAESMQREKEEAEQALDRFEAEVEVTKEKVAGDLKERGRKSLVSELKKALGNEANLTAALNRVIDQDPSPRTLGRRLGQEATGIVQRSIAGWQANVVNGSSAAAQRILTEILQPGGQRVQELADRAGAEAPGLLPRLQVTLGTTEVQVDYSSIDSAIRSIFQPTGFNEAVDGVEDFFDDLDSDLGDWFRGFRKGFSKFIGKDEEFKAKVPGAVEMVQEAAEKLAKLVVKQYVKAVAQAFQKEVDQAVAEIRLVYAARIQQREVDLARGLEEKQRVVREAAEQKKRVHALRDRITDFADRVNGKLENAA